LKVVDVLRRVLASCKNNLCYSLNGSFVKPSLLVFEVTRRCNSRCVMCHSWKIKNVNHEITPQELDKILWSKLFSEIESVILTGGEPTIRDDLTELVKVIHKNCSKASIWFSTNGLSHKNLIEAIKYCQQQNITFGVGVSLDGICGTHDKLRGVNGNFMSCVRLLKTLREMNVIATIGFTLSPLTVNNLLDLKTWNNNRNPLLIQKFDCSEFYNTSGKLKNVEAEKQIVESLPDSYLKYHWLRQLDGETKSFKCFALYKFFVLHANGDVSPCLRHYDLTCGNMLHEEPMHLWRRIKFDRKMVKSCNPQCLNDWVFGESVKAEYFGLLWFKAKKLLGIKH
jgi:MoaA/NifB/PqqE/SkfB family radical SAM enzyme